MPLVNPPTLDDLPATPDRADRTSFAVRCTALFDQLKNTTLAQWRSAMAWMNAAAADAAASATASANSAASAASASNAAQTAAGVAIGSSNFKGNWSALAGALNTPACVKHNGRFWLLLNNQADVAAAQPGVSAAWTALDTGSAPSAVITVNTTAVVGVRYRIAGACTLTIPAGLLQGDFIGVSLMEGVTGAYINFGATRFQGKDVGLMLLNTKLLHLPMFYENPTLGLCR